MKRSEQLLLQEEVWVGRLPGGGRVWVVPRAGRRCHALLSVDFGAVDDTGASTDERPIPEGVAHFLEHRLFEKPEGDITERFSDLGAEVDAQTGFTNTSFSFTVGPEAFERALALLFELAGRPYFPEESVGRERAIIQREIRLFEDNVEWVAFQTAMAALYGDQRIAVDIAGTEASLGRIDADLLASCHRRHYHAGAVQLFVCGPVDPDQVLDCTAGLVGDWPAPRPLPARAPFVAVPAQRRASRSIPRTRRLLAFPNPAGSSGRDLLHRELCLELALDILFGPSSEFFARHYESGLIDGDSFGGEIHTEPTHCFCLLGGDTDEPERLQQAIVEELEPAVAGDLIESGFERAWRRAYGDMVCRWEEVESCVDLLESTALRCSHPFELVDLYAGDGRVEAVDVYGCLDHCLRPYGFATATVQPA